MESRTQGSRPRPRTKKISRPRPRTDPLEAKAKDQGHRHKSSPKKKRFSKNFFRRFPLEENKKKGLRKFSARFLELSNKISPVQKIVLSSSRGQGNFRGLEVSKPRPRTSKCVLEAKDVLEDSTSGVQIIQ